MVETITVDLGSRSYPIYIGEGLLGQLPALLDANHIARKLMVVTNPVVAELYGNRLMGTLRTSGFSPGQILIPDGETYKSLVTAGHLYEDLSKNRAERGTPILALGGGVIGDLAGFVAATYQRGVPFIQVPTTLLAQVDSSIGGKVAVNVGRLKNMAGVFYQPKMVVCDVASLKSLPEPEMRNGLAEMIKSAIIADPELFVFLETEMPRILDREPDVLTFIVKHSAAVKARIVEQDERDQGVRNILNLGHTFGHAIESATKFEVKHGAAVAAGTAAASRLAHRLGLLSAEERDRILRLIAAAGLPTSFSVSHPAAFIDAMRHDKKIDNGKLKFILPSGIGKVVARDDIDTNIAIEALAQ
jgi:3-dehydroquinate synthase